MAYPQWKSAFWQNERKIMFETTTCIGVALGHSLVFLSPVKETRIYIQCDESGSHASIMVYIYNIILKNL